MTTPIYHLVFADLTTDATPVALRPAQSFTAIIDAAGEFVDVFSANYLGVSVSFRVASDLADRKPGEIAVNFRDSIPEAPDALAYHQVVGGVPDIELGVDLFGNLTADNNSLSVGFTHELAEMLGDPGANGWKDKGDGTMCAEETCDLVQNTWRAADNGVAVTNFLLPNYFIPGSAGPWDHQGVLASPTDVSNGYEIRTVSPSNITQATLAALIRGVHHVGTISNPRAKRHPFSRSRRRGLLVP